MSHIATSAVVRHVSVFLRDDDDRDQKQNVYNL